METTIATPISQIFCNLDKTTRASELLVELLTERVKEGERRGEQLQQEVDCQLIHILLLSSLSSSSSSSSSSISCCHPRRRHQLHFHHQCCHCYQQHNHNKIRFVITIIIDKNSLQNNISENPRGHMYILTQVTALEEENKGLREYTENLRRLALNGAVVILEEKILFSSNIYAK